MISRVLTLLTLLLGTVADAPGGAGPAGAPATPDLVAAAEAAFARGDFDAALAAYGRIRASRPDAPELSYNMGVAAYRAGRLDEAVELFRDTLAQTDDPALRARTAYNLGTTEYARTLRGEDAAAPAAAPEDADDATASPADPRETLKEALAHYRDALAADPANADARFNAELTQRLLTRLEEMAEQQPQPSPDQEQEGEEGEQEQEQQQDQQQQQQGEQSDEQENATDQQRARQQQEPGESDEPQEASQEQEQEQEQTDEQPAPGDDQDSSSAGEEGEPDEADDAVDEPERRGLSRAEAERQLQRVRDRERARREELARREAGKLPPVDKDW